MNVVYYCKHCKSLLGTIDSTKTSMESLGFSILTPEERSDIMEFDAVSQTIYVKTVCEYCETALRQHPELLLTPTPLQ
ncbi:MAG: anti-sigma-F factor Fin [Bacilli bacterium]